MHKYNPENQESENYILDVIEDEFDESFLEDEEEPDPELEELIHEENISEFEMKYGFKDDGSTRVAVVLPRRLNLRAEPNKASKVLSVLEQDTKVYIGLDQSTEDFYSVSAPGPYDGFCVKEFLDVQE